MKKSLAVCITFAVLLAACVMPVRRPAPPGCDRLFIVSSVLADDQYLAVREAVQTWNGVATEQYCVTREGDEKAETARDSVAYMPTPEPPIVGFYMPTSGQIRISPDLDIETFRVVATHEFGHAHGLGHTPPPSVMHATLGTADQLTQQDIAECVDVGACAPARKEDPDGGI